MNDTDRAVVVGIGRYPSLTPLSGAENDAIAMREWLVDPAGGGLPEDNVKTILSSDFEECPDPVDSQPTAEEVRKEFDRLISMGEEAGGRIGRRLYIFMAGHGVAPDVDDAALLMANAARTRLMYLPGGKIAAWFRTAPLFDEVVLLMDCCRDHSGRLPDYALPWLDMGEQGHDARWVYGFATKWSRKSREKPMDDGTVRGLFTYVVLEGLRQGHTTASRLKEFVLARLPELADEDSYQKPVILFDEDMVIAETAGPPETGLRVNFGPARPGVTVELLNGSLEVIDTHPHGGEAWEIPAPPGLYSVRASDAEQPALVQLTAGTADVTV